MRYAFSFFLSAWMLSMVSCGNGDVSPAQPDAPTPSEATAPNGIPAKKAPRKAYTEEELNRPYSTVSPWRYVVTGPETQYFERLVTYSELGRTVHGSGHAVLVPRDETFKENKEWKALIEEENRDALVRFVKAHILVGLQSPKSLEGAYENLNGDMVVIERDDRGELVCGGARLLGQEVETDYGLVLPVVGMVEEIRWN